MNVPPIFRTFDIGVLHVDQETGDSIGAFLERSESTQLSWSVARKESGDADVEVPVGGTGTSTQVLGISKPDLGAPGMSIVAGTTPKPLDRIEERSEARLGELFEAMTGTSMASPHVAGAAALIKAEHPDWTPGRIKSALMTSTVTEGLLGLDGRTPATPFDLGSGRLDAFRAMQPGLTLDATAEDYLAHTTELWTTNYPSFYHPRMPATVTVQRTVRSEETQRATWHLKVTGPEDLVIVVPSELTLEPGQELTFDIAIDASRVAPGEVRHAQLVFEGPGNPHMPLTIVRSEEP